MPADGFVGHRDYANHVAAFLNEATQRLDGEVRSAHENYPHSSLT